MKRLFRLLLLAGVVYAVWKRFAGRYPSRRALIAWADGSSVVLEEGSPDLERLAAVAARATGL